MSSQSGLKQVPWDIKILILKETVTGIVTTLKAPFDAEYVSGREEMLNTQNLATFNATVSSLALVSTFVFGRVSDRFSRRTILLLLYACSAANTVFILVAPDCFYTWAFTAHTLGAAIACVRKALLQDHSIASGASQADTAYWISVCQVVGGIVGAVGPALSPFILSTRWHALIVVAVVDVTSLPLVFLLGPGTKKTLEKQWKLRDFLDLKSVRSHGGLFFLSWMFLIVLIFHACQTILLPSLQTRFQPDAKMHGMMQSVQGIGTMFGSILSAPLARHFYPQRPEILLSSFMVMTITSRMVMFWTSSWQALMVASFVFTTFGIGVIGPIRNSIPTQIVQSEELGGFVGCQEAVEYFSGVVGPLLVAVLNLQPELSAKTIVGFSLYAVMPLYQFFGYPRFIVPQAERLRAERNAKAKVS